MQGKTQQNLHQKGKVNNDRLSNFLNMFQDDWKSQYESINKKEKPGWRTLHKIANDFQSLIFALTLHLRYYRNSWLRLSFLFQLQSLVVRYQNDHLEKLRLRKVMYDPQMFYQRELQPISNGLTSSKRKGDEFSTSVTSDMF